MTFAIAIKVNDGIVLAADSASTISASRPDGTSEPVNVFNNADKIVNLRKGLPIGLIFWGSGSIGSTSMSRLGKDLRLRLAGHDRSAIDWRVQTDNYTISDIAERVKEFIIDQTYEAEYADVEGDKRPTLGMLVAGYSSDSSSAEGFRIEVNQGVCTGPTLVLEPGISGARWFAQAEAASRLLLGFSPRLPLVLRDHLGVPEEDLTEVMALITSELNVPFLVDSMPIQDVIDLAEYLVDVTVKFYRFGPGWPIVGGPIEIAAITRHEGFKWIRRKHYYDHALNPEEAPWNTPALHIQAGEE